VFPSQEESVERGVPKFLSESEEDVNKRDHFPFHLNFNSSLSVANSSCVVVFTAVALQSISNMTEQDIHPDDSRDSSPHILAHRQGHGYAGRGVMVFIGLLLRSTLCLGQLYNETKLTANDAVAVDTFGGAVSISGDFAIVGAKMNDGTQSGSAYIFLRNGTSWKEQAKLTASDTDQGDVFGFAVGISGDYVIVSALGDDDAGDDSGSAYIFLRNGTSWTEQGKLTASDAAARDGFGAEVGISGDYAIVGGHDYPQAGSAYIYNRNGTSWTEQAKLTASDAAAGDFFGWTVSNSGDYAIVGALADDNNGGIDSGSAYIFQIADGMSRQSLLLFFFALI